MTNSLSCSPLHVGPVEGVGVGDGDLATAKEY
jgi:hypothetical protein